MLDAVSKSVTVLAIRLGLLFWLLASTLFIVGDTVVIGCIVDVVVLCVVFVVVVVPLVEYWYGFCVPDGRITIVPAPCGRWIVVNPLYKL